VSIVDNVERALAKADDPKQSQQFVEQVSRLREFRQKLDEAGVVLEPETLPDTMTLIGQFRSMQRG